MVTRWHWLADLYDLSGMDYFLHIRFQTETIMSKVYHQAKVGGSTLARTVPPADSPKGPRVN